MSVTIKRTGRPGQSAHREVRQSECFSIKIADPLGEWLDQTKPSRNRQPKRSWKRGKQRGYVDVHLLACSLIFGSIVMMFVMAMLLLVGEMCHG